MPDTIRFVLPSNENLYVDLKRHLSWGDGRALQVAKVTSPSEEEGNLAFAATLLERAIVAWNLKDETGNDRAVTPEAIADYLTFEDAQQVIQEASKALAAMARLDVPNSSTVSRRTSRQTARSRSTRTSASST